MMLFHGGVPDLRPGDVLSPRSASHISHLVAGCPTCEARRQGNQLAEDPNDPRLIYVTTDKAYARIYAAGYPRGALYRVEVDEPLGDELEDDPVPSWGVASARIASVLDPVVILSPKRVRSLLRKYAL